MDLVELEERPVSHDVCLYSLQERETLKERDV